MSYPPYGGGPGYPPSDPGYPPNPGYPPAAGNPGYPPSNPGYPPSDSAYPPAQPPYPVAAAQPGYPPAPGPPSGPQIGFGDPVAPYPPAGPGYPPAAHVAPPLAQPLGGPSFAGAAYAVSAFRHPPAASFGSPAPPQPMYSGNVPAPYPAGPGQGMPSSQGYGNPPPSHVPAPVVAPQSHPAPMPSYSAPPAQPPSQSSGYYQSSPPVSPSAAQATARMASLRVTEESGKGTLKPARPFNKEADCEVLRKAMKGFGTNEKAIISVLGYRTNDQRVELISTYKTMFGKDLVADLKSELSGNFNDLVLALMQTLRQFDARELRRAMKGIGTDESVLIEILCTRTNAVIAEIKREYKKIFGRNLEADVVSETSGHFKRLLVSMCQGNRDESHAVDQRRAAADAQDLYKAGEARWGTDESKFNVVLASRSYAQLRATFEEYRKVCKYDIEQSIEREMSGDIKAGMLTIVRCVKDKTGYFAERIYRSMKGIGTDDRTLQRCIVSRCEVDMVQIKSYFVKHYKHTLAKWIQGDTGGNYRRLLLALIGEEH